MSPDILQQLVLWFVPTLLSLTVHEWAHAASADALGDDTARRAGRLTLNPVAHADPLGTLLLPVVQVVLSGHVMFAWAKPVPVTPVRFRRDVSMSLGNVLVAAAGPISNLLLATGAVVGLALAGRFGVGTEPVQAFLGAMLWINVALAVFNLLPIPPLDGSHVLHGLLPRRAALAYERIFPYAPVLLLGLIFFGRGWMGLPVALVAGLLDRFGSLFAG